MIRCRRGSTALTKGTTTSSVLLHIAAPCVALPRRRQHGDATRCEVGGGVQYSAASLSRAQRAAPSKQEVKWRI